MGVLGVSVCERMACLVIFSRIDPTFKENGSRKSLLKELEGGGGFTLPRYGANKDKNGDIRIDMKTSKYIFSPKVV